MDLDNTDILNGQLIVKGFYEGRSDHKFLQDSIKIWDNKKEKHIYLIDILNLHSGNNVRITIESL